MHHAAYCPNPLVCRFMEQAQRHRGKSYDKFELAAEKWIEEKEFDAACACGATSPASQAAELEVEVEQEEAALDDPAVVVEVEETEPAAVAPAAVALAAVAPAAVAPAPAVREVVKEQAQRLKSLQIQMLFMTLKTKRTTILKKVKAKETE